MTQHTPGPWRRRIVAPTFEHTSIQTADGKLAVARVFKKADARLIVAAPDLLAACRAMLAELDGGNDFAAWEAAKEQLRAAVARVGD